MYLLLGALAAFAEFYVRSGILVYGDAAQTAHNTSPPSACSVSG